MNNLNPLTKKLIILLVSIAVIAGCIYSGKVEYNDAVLSNMSDSKYQYILDRIGGHASQSEIVSEYTTNQEYYDSVHY